METTKLTTGINATVKEWLSQLPDEYREKALSNMDEFMKDEPADSMSSAVEAGFDWEESPEGFEYWEAIFIWYTFSEFSDHKLPELS